LLLAVEFALDDPEDVRRDHGVEALAALGRRDDVVLEERAHGGQELERRGSVLHQPSSIRSSSSSSISTIRRPRLASSTFRAPRKNVRACMMQMTPHLSLPNPPHPRTTSASPGAPLARS